ncbi:MAG TPA: hypothetical protein VF547_08590 [Allosphingosinicella sp.]|jgi:hypothetical protein
MTNKLNRPLLAAVLPAAMLIPAAPAAAQGSPTYEYAAKFVCAASSNLTPPVAVGHYYTAVNVHNPGIDVKVAWKVALAGTILPGKITGFDSQLLKNDEAMEIDCRSIRNRITASGLPNPAAFFTGFVVIRAPAPVDVVSVYTASAQVNGPVVSIHTERVPARQLP